MYIYLHIYFYTYHIYIYMYIFIYILYMYKYITYIHVTPQYIRLDWVFDPSSPYIYIYIFNRLKPSQTVFSRLQPS